MPKARTKNLPRQRSFRPYRSASSDLPPNVCRATGGHKKKGQFFVHLPSRIGSEGNRHFFKTLKAALESDIYKRVKEYKVDTLLKNHQRQLKGLSCLHSQRWQRNPEEVEKTCAEHSARLAREKLPVGVHFTKSNGSYGVCITTRFGTMHKRTTSWDFAVELLQKFRRPPEEMRMFFGYRTREEIKASVAKNAELVAAGEALPEGVSWIEDRISNGAKNMWRATRHVLGFGLCSQNLALWEWVKQHTRLVDEHNAAYRLEHANDTEDESDDDEVSAPVRCSAVSDDDESDESDDDDSLHGSPALMMVNKRPRRSSTLVRRVYVEPGDDPIAESIAEAAASAATAADAASAGGSNSRTIVLDSDNDDDALSVDVEVVEATEASSSESSSDDDVSFVNATVVSAAETSAPPPPQPPPPPTLAPVAPLAAPPPSPQPEKNDLQTKLEALAKLKELLSTTVYESRQKSLLVQAGL